MLLKILFRLDMGSVEQAAKQEKESE